MKGTLSATDYLFKRCDGKLTDEDLTEAGRAFAAAYYGEDGLYFDDFIGLFGDALYEQPEEFFSFEALSELMGRRLKTGVLTRGGLKKKPWWKFWEK